MQSMAGEYLSGTPLLAVSLTAQSYFNQPGFGWLTNSLFVAVLVLLIVLITVRVATKDVRLVPTGVQNGIEFLFEFLYGQVEQIVGKQVAPRAFPLLATIFVFVLISNWLGLIPGVGTIGFSSPDQRVGFMGFANEPEIPLLRPATADVNMTLGIALTFMVVWFYITMREAGPIQFLKHMFAPKGGLKGVMWLAVLPIFIIVGFIEIISIAFRPVSLSLRLFGNIYAGETLLHTMGTLGKDLGVLGAFISSIVIPFPFYFMELLVGMLQAIIFSLLCAVYIQLSTAHEEEEH